MILSLWFGKIDENYLRSTLFFKQFARYSSVYVLGAFPALLKVLSCNFGAILLKKPKNVCDSVPLTMWK